MFLLSLLILDGCIRREILEILVKTKHSSIYSIDSNYATIVVGSNLDVNYPPLQLQK